MATRYIKILIDTQSLLSSPAPTVASCVYMVAPSEMSPYNQAQDELGVTVNNGDTVIWSASGFDAETKITLIKAKTPGILDTNMTTVYNDDGTVSALATKDCNAGIYRFAFTVDDQDFSQYSWDPYMTIEN